MAKQKDWTPADHADHIANYERLIAEQGPKENLVTILKNLRAKTPELLAAYSLKRIKHYTRGKPNACTDGEYLMWDQLLRTVVYPITHTDAGYVVTSYIRTVHGGHETWEHATKAMAEEKVEQLIQWDLESRRDKGYGNFLEDIALWSTMGEARVAA
jgi:hypothetical protein